MKTFRIIFVILLIGLPPTVSCLPNFMTGYFYKSKGMSLEYGLDFVFGVPIFVGIAIGRLIPVRRIISRIGIGLGSIFFSGFLTLFAVPVGAVTYSQGFEYALGNQVGLNRLQQWSQEALVQFQNGQIHSAGKPSCWSPGDVLISTKDLPEFLKTEIFKPSGLYDFGPEVSICKVGCNIGASQNCIAISWHLLGALVGSPNFTSEWNPWYCKAIAPGVY